MREVGGEGGGERENAKRERETSTRTPQDVVGITPRP